MHRLYDYHLFETMNKQVTWNFGFTESGLLRAVQDFARHKHMEEINDVSRTWAVLGRFYLKYSEKTKSAFKEAFPKKAAQIQKKMVNQNKLNDFKFLNSSVLFFRKMRRRNKIYPDGQ